MRLFPQEFTLGIVSYLVIIYLILPFSVSASEIVIDDYREGISPIWVEKTFSGKTRYEAVIEDGRPCIKAVSSTSASGLYYKIDYDLEKYPFISWKWKVKNIISKGDARRKSGDDYAARLYVVFSSPYFWKTHSINYIWANKLPQDTSVPSSYTKNSIMIAVQSGMENANKWQEESRNVLEDYRNTFGGDPPKVGAIAIMTDTDNTGEEAVAWYGEIKIFNEKCPE